MSGLFQNTCASRLGMDEYPCKSKVGALAGYLARPYVLHQPRQFFQSPTCLHVPRMRPRAILWRAAGLTWQVVKGKTAGLRPESGELTDPCDGTGSLPAWWTCPLDALPTSHVHAGIATCGQAWDSWYPYRMRREGDKDQSILPNHLSR